MELISNLGVGLDVALNPANVAFCFAGVMLGTLVGVIPGLGALTAMSLLFPLTFYFDTTAALIMLAGIWYGTTYGGSTAAILLNIPGTHSTAVTCLDGYPMAQKGRGGVALFMTTIASFVGGSVGILLMMAATPTIAEYALRFGSAEYFALMLLGLIAASSISTENAIKGLAMVVLGVFFGTIGTDIYSGVDRFTFGRIELTDGISLVALAMGLFGVSEVIWSIGRTGNRHIDRSTVGLRSMIPTREDWCRSSMPMARGAGLGSFFGALPGTGPAVAAFISYALEKRVSRDPGRFGKGAIEGIAAPESANNAADMTAFIPTLSLGIPGSPTMALMLGVLMIHGVQPGPALVIDEPSLFWGLVMSFWIGNLLLLVINIPLIGLWVRLLLVPYRLLFPAVLMFICIGTYAVHSSVADVWMVLFFGALGYGLRLLDLPAAPVLLGFVLGPLMEEHFRRAMLLARGDYLVFFERPLSGAVMYLCLALLVWTTWDGFRRKRSSMAGSATD